MLGNGAMVSIADIAQRDLTACGEADYAEAPATSPAGARRRATASASTPGCSPTSSRPPCGPATADSAAEALAHARPRRAPASGTPLGARLLTLAPRACSRPVPRPTRCTGRRSSSSARTAAAVDLARAHLLVRRVAAPIASAAIRRTRAAARSRTSSSPRSGAHRLRERARVRARGDRVSAPARGSVETAAT